MAPEFARLAKNQTILVKALKAELKEAKSQVRLSKRDTGFGDWKKHQKTVERIEAELARHKALEDEKRNLGSLIKSTEQNRDELVAKAREKISDRASQQIISARFKRKLFESYQHYLRSDQRACFAAIENLWNKYAVTATQIEQERDEAIKSLNKYLVELGYK